MRTRLMVVVVMVILYSSVLVGQGNRGATGPCDKACLEGIAEQYLDAYAARDPKRLGLTANVRYTENGQRLELGDGGWNVATGKGKYRLFVTDVQTGNVAFLGTITEEPNVSSLIAVRLKVVNRQISEIESLIVRPAAGGGARGAGGGTPAPPPAQRLEAMGVPHTLWTQTIPPAERMSREDLIKTANMYFTGMQLNDGKGVYPFTDDCDRFENASLSTNVPTRPGETRPDPRTASTYSSQWSCKEQFQSGLIHFVTRIRDRRFVAVDPERGLVFSFVFFDHAAGRTRTYPTPDGRTVTGGPTTPWTWEIAELFRIEKGLIRRIEAILVQSPYGQNSGWSSYEDGMSDRARDIR